MEIKLINVLYYYRIKLLRNIMRIFLLLLCTSVFSLSSTNVLSQNAKVEIKEDQVITVDQVFEIIKQQTDYRFIYKSDMFKDFPKISLKKGIIETNDLLKKCLSNGNFSITVTANNSIIIKEQKYEALQNLTVTGKVVDVSGVPIPGVTVYISKSRPQSEEINQDIVIRAISTDFDGGFSLIADVGDFLTTSSLGFGSQSQQVSADNTVYDFILVEKLSELEEVLLVGYGSTKKKDVTGSISRIDMEGLNDQVPVNFDNALVGRAPGVFVLPSNGTPGSSAAIRIRGTTSVVGNNEPLYIIDGVPVEIGFGESNASFQDNSFSQASPLSAINPQDIATIDILKDASATAIYGSRASNGVVIITTKTGKKSGETSVTFNVTTSVTSFLDNKRRTLTSSQFQDVVQQAYENVNRPVLSDEVLYPYGRDIDTDWVDAISQTGFTTDYYLNVGGSSKNRETLYSLSAGLTDQTGTINSTGFERQTLRSKVETRLGKFRTGLNINYNDSKQIGNTQFYSTATFYNPAIPIEDENGNPGQNRSSNPLTYTNYKKEIDNSNLAFTLFMELEILKNLFFKSSYSNNIIESLSTSYSPITDALNTNFNIAGSLSLVDNTYTSKIFDNTLTYTNKFGDHNVSALIGSSHTANNTERTTTDAQGFPDDTVSVYPGAADLVSITNAGTISGLASYFIRANYNLSNTYYLTFTGRADKSTKFGPNNRWGYFPSGALAWRFSNESFMENVNFVNDLKLRASYGKTGTANFDDFQYSTFFTLGNYYGGINGPVANVIPNPDIKWESTNQLDIALEYTLFDQRISGSLGYFNKKTNNQILLRDIVFETGGNNQFFNIGDFSNTGFEFLLGVDVFRDTKLKWTTNLNLSTVNSKVLNLNGAYFENLREGDPIDAFYGLRVVGIFQTQEEIDALNAASPTGLYQNSGTAPGDFKFQDTNGDNRVNIEDNVNLGQAAPDIYGGWNNTISYGNFQLTALFNFSIGNTIANFGKRNEFTMQDENTNAGPGILNAWTPENTDTNIPRVAYRDPNGNRRFSDFYIEDASFIKLKNINISYRFDSDLLKKLAITNASIFLSGTNLFTITSYSGFDPEINDEPTNNFQQGYDYQRYPSVRTFSLGLNLNF